RAARGGGGRRRRPGAAHAAVPALAAARGLDKRKLLFGGLGVAAVLLLALVGWALSGPGEGLIMLDLQSVPAAVRGNAKVMLDMQPVTLAEGNSSLLKTVPAGKVSVVVTAEGYKPFTRTVDVVEGKDVASLQVVLESLVSTATLMLVTQPEDAEVKVDGKVVRVQGKTDAFLNDVPVLGPEWVVEVSAPGHKPQSRQVPVSNGGRAQLSVKLERVVTQVAVKVESKPAGATIFVDGKEWANPTPTTVQVPATTKQLLLKLKCHDEAEVDVPESDEGQAPAIAKVSLKRVRGCR
ncbi:PEGA domain-containing protein, partial [Pyxidicoccus sp. 3LG]